jgi:hypothetical protein
MSGIGGQEAGDLGATLFEPVPHKGRQRIAVGQGTVDGRQTGTPTMRSVPAASSW